MPPRQNFPPIDVPRALLEALGSALRAAVLALSAACKEQIAPPKRGAKSRLKERFSGRKNQAEVSSSSIGAILAVSVGKMLSYIARAS
jgi:hypothetical protein